MIERRKRLEQRFWERSADELRRPPLEVATTWKAADESKQREVKKSTECVPEEGFNAKQIEEAIEELTSGTGIAANQESLTAYCDLALEQLKILELKLQKIESTRTHEIALQKDTIFTI
eukprot:Trichotokara_eunicae@DN167_c0_g1_i1.p1